MEYQNSTSPSILQYFKQAFSFYLNAFLTNSLTPLRLPGNNISNMAGEANITDFAIGVIIAFILAMIATLIGANLIGPVATAVGGALNNKNLTGAANSLTSQVTLIFVTVVIVGVVTFLALFGGLAGRASREA